MDNTRKNEKASDQQPKELTEAEKIQAMMRQDNPEYDPTNLPPIPKKWTSRPRAVYKRAHYPNRTWRKAEATPSTSECPQVQPKELLSNLAKKVVNSDPPADMTETSPACLTTSHQQMAQISTKPHRPERPMESAPPRAQGSLPREVCSERPSSSGPNGNPENLENFGCNNIRRHGGPPPPPQQQQQHWGQQPHMWAPPNVSPPFCATQLTVGPPLGYDDSFHRVPPPEYMPVYQNSWPPHPEMSDHHPYPGYYYEGQPSPMDYVHAEWEPARAMNAHYSPPYRMDERLGEREDKFARSEIKDPVQEFERFLAEKDSRKLALQTIVRKRPRSRSISPRPRRTLRNSSERSQSRRRRSFSRSPSPKRRRSYSRRQDGKSRSPSRNTTSNRKEKRIFGEHVENETRKGKRTRSPSSSKSTSSSDSNRRKDRKEKRKDESSRSRSKR